MEKLDIVTPHRDQIQTLLAEIDRVLSKASPRLPFFTSPELTQQRQTLEHLRQYLSGLADEIQTQGSLQSAIGTNAPLNFRSLDLSSDALAQADSPDAALALTQETLQNFAQDLQQLRRSLLQPLQTEMTQLHAQRDALVQEVRQLERQRQQYGLTQQRASQEQLIHEFLQRLMDRIQDRLSQQVSQTLANLNGMPPQGQLAGQDSSARLGPNLGSNLGASTAGAMVPGLATGMTPGPIPGLGDAYGNLAALGTDNPQLPPLHPAQRYEQLQQLQSQTDQMMMGLDSTLRVFAEALQQNIQSYQTSLAASLERMHSLGQQGEAVFSSLVTRLADQLGDEALGYLQNSGQLAATAGAPPSTPRQVSSARTAAPAAPHTPSPRTARTSRSPAPPRPPASPRSGRPGSSTFSSGSPASASPGSRSTNGGPPSPNSPSPIASRSASTARPTPPEQTDRALPSSASILDLTLPYPGVELSDDRLSVEPDGELWGDSLPDLDISTLNLEDLERDELDSLDWDEADGPDLNPLADLDADLGQSATIEETHAAPIREAKGDDFGDFGRSPAAGATPAPADGVSLDGSTSVNEELDALYTSLFGENTPEPSASVNEFFGAFEEEIGNAERSSQRETAIGSNPGLDPTQSAPSSNPPRPSTPGPSPKFAAAAPSPDPTPLGALDQDSDQALAEDLTTDPDLTESLDRAIEAVIDAAVDVALSGSSPTTNPTRPDLTTGRATPNLSADAAALGRADLELNEAGLFEADLFEAGATEGDLAIIPEPLSLGEVGATVPETKGIGTVHGAELDDLADLAELGELPSLDDNIGNRNLADLGGRDTTGGAAARADSGTDGVYGANSGAIEADTLDPLDAIFEFQVQVAQEQLEALEALNMDVSDFIGAEVEGALDALEALEGLTEMDFATVDAAADAADVLAIDLLTDEEVEAQERLAQQSQSATQGAGPEAPAPPAPVPPPVPPLPPTAAGNEAPLPPTLILEPLDGEEEDTRPVLEEGEDPREETEDETTVPDIGLPKQRAGVTSDTVPPGSTISALTDLLVSSPPGRPDPSSRQSRPSSPISPTAMEFGQVEESYLLASPDEKLLVTDDTDLSLEQRLEVEEETLQQLSEDLFNLEEEGMSLGDGADFGLGALSSSRELGFLASNPIAEEVPDLLPTDETGGLSLDPNSPTQPTSEPFTSGLDQPRGGNLGTGQPDSPSYPTIEVLAEAAQEPSPGFGPGVDLSLDPDPLPETSLDPLGQASVAKDTTENLGFQGAIQDQNPIQKARADLSRDRAGESQLDTLFQEPTEGRSRSGLEPDRPDPQTMATVQNWPASGSATTPTDTAPPLLTLETLEDFNQDLQQESTELPLIEDSAETVEALFSDFGDNEGNSGENLDLRQGELGTVEDLAILGDDSPTLGTKGRSEVTDRAQTSALDPAMEIPTESVLDVLANLGGESAWDDRPNPARSSTPVTSRSTTDRSTTDRDDLDVLNALDALGQAFADSEQSDQSDQTQLDDSWNDLQSTPEATDARASTPANPSPANPDPDPDPDDDLLGWSASLFMDPEPLAASPKADRNSSPPAQPKPSATGLDNDLDGLDLFGFGEDLDDDGEERLPPPPPPPPPPRADRPNRGTDRLKKKT